MASTTWASPRDEFPESVHALMSLWGGFASPTDYSDSGLEKRLELDFHCSIDVAVFSAAELEGVFAATNQQPCNFMTENGLAALETMQSMLIVTARRFIITASSEVMMHELLAPALTLLQQKGIKVEWASFFRKNATSPWNAENETSDIMAQEYADLKAAFPTGQSFLTGPVDGDHYFSFVYDAIQRGDSREETDVQVNAFLYDVSRVMEVQPKTTKQYLRPLPNGEYEMTRVFTDVPCVSFETNAVAATTSPTRIQQLLDTHQPSRFTIIALQDKDTDGFALQHNFQNFVGFSLQNRTVNYFGGGYAFQQLVFARTA